MASSIPAVHTDVVIVGAGPAGAALACFLASHGIRGLILELNSSSADTPRAHITNMAALECLRDIGLDKVAVKLATKDECMTHTRWCESMAGREYARIYSWGNDPARKGDYESASPCQHCDLPQSLLEPELVRYATLHGFQIRWNTEFLRFEQSESGVRVWAKDCVLGVEYTIESKYLFGADGARSKIVQQLDLPLVKQEGGGPALNVLVKADLSHLITHRTGNLHWVYRPDRETPDWAWLSIVRMVKPWHEWMFIVLPKPGTDLSKRPTKEEFEKEARAQIGDDTPLEVLRTNVWNINDIIASTYSKGRVFCLGDAVHRHPPFNGLGSNTCIQDAFNLAWKITYVLKGIASPSLLDSFSIERQPVGQAVVRRANGGFREHFTVWEALGVTADSTAERVRIVKELGEASEEGQSRRMQFRKAIYGTRYEFHGLGVEMNQTYNSSAVLGDLTSNGDGALADPTKENSDDILFYIPSTVPGRRLPHIWLSNAVPDGLTSTIDIAGHGGFTIFTGIGGEAWRDAATTVSSKLNIPIKVIGIGFGQDFEDLYFAWNDIRAIEESGCILVRPDRYIAWRVNTVQSPQWAEEQLLGALSRILSLSSA